MALKFSMILEAVDRATAPAKRIKSALSGLTSGVRRWGQDVRRVSNDITSGSRSLEHYERRARRLRQVALGSFFRAASQQARRFVDSLDRGIKKLDLLGRAGRGAKAGLSWMGGRMLGAAKWAAAGASAVASYSLFDMLKTGGQFEQYQTMLEGTEGSAAGARKAMAWVQKFAKDTPYELDQVMEAFVALKGYGIDPTNGSLMALGDGAAGMNKDIGQAVEALADAVTGEFERLKEFSIRASQAGDKVTFTYQKNGKDIQRTVKKTGSEIEKAITSIFVERFGGGMARLSGTLFGIMNNLKDLWNGFLLMVANAGIFDKVKAGLEQLRASMEAMSDDGRMQQWAQQISDNLSKAWDWGVKFVKETDWQRVAKDLKTIADAAMGVARAIVWITEKLQALARVNVPPEIWLGLKVAGWVGRSGAAQPSNNANGATGAQPRSTSERNRLWQNANPGRSWITRPQGGNAPSWNRLPKGGGKISSAAPAAQVGGALDINVKVQGPAVASVARVTTVNRAVPINAKVGKVMAAPA